MNKEKRSKYFSTPARLSSLPTFDSSISTLRFRNVGLNNTILTCQEEKNTRSPNEKEANHRFQRVPSGTSSSDQRDYKGVSRSTSNGSENGAQLKR